MHNYDVHEMYFPSVGNRAIKQIIKELSNDLNFIFPPIVIEWEFDFTNC